MPLSHMTLQIALRPARIRARAAPIAGSGGKEGFELFENIFAAFAL